MQQALGPQVYMALGLSTIPVYGYDRTFYGRQPYRENFSPVRVW